MFRKPFLHFKDFQGIVINLSTRVWGCSGMDEFRLWRDRFCDLGTEGSNHARTMQPSPDQFHFSNQLLAVLKSVVSTKVTCTTSFTN